MITVGKNSGFCYGVKKAIECLEANIGENVYTFGEIIHNPNVVQYFSKKGVKIIENVDDVTSGKVIIRSHGVKKCTIENLRNKGITVVDATCKFVKKIHDIVSQKHALGYKIIIIGKSYHPEVIGINGWCDDSAVIVDSGEELLKEMCDRKMCIVVQTTYEKSAFLNFLKNIPERYVNLVEIFDTICYTTIRRQEEAEILSKENDVMIVIGGKHSSNTKKLYDICKKNCDNSYMLENATELDFVEINKKNKIGVVAGASTPNGLIKEVFLKMADMQNEAEEKVTEEKAKPKKVAVKKTEDGEEKPVAVKKTAVKAEKSAEEKAEKPVAEKKTAVKAEKSAEEKAEKPVAEKKTAVKAEKSAEEKAEKPVAEKKEKAVKSTDSEVAQKVEKPKKTAVKEDKITMDDVMETLENNNVKKGKIIQVTISEVQSDGVMVSVPGYKRDDFFIHKDELCFNEEYSESNFEIGDALDVKVIDLKPTMKLSKRAIVAEEIESKEVQELVDSKKEFSMTFNESNKGGLVGRFGNCSVFVPASQIKIGYITEVDKYKGKPLRLEITEYDAEKKKIVASQRIILERERQVKDEERQKKEDSFWESIAEGQIVEGKVVRISDFGAFVSVNGFDCLAHKSDLSWTPISKVEDVLEKNNSYEFRVLRLDRENKKVSLGYKQLQAHPWDSVVSRYPVDSIVQGRVARIAPFGAFIELEHGVDGLVHVSQICHEWIEKPEEKLNIDDVITARVLDVSAENQKITLSIKALVEAPPRVERPRRENDNESGGEVVRQQRPQKYDNRARAQKPFRREDSNEEGMTSWTDSSSSSASIGDMLKAFNIDIEEK